MNALIVLDELINLNFIELLQICCTMTDIQVLYISYQNNVNQYILSSLTTIYNIVADLNPLLDVFPLFNKFGWTHREIATKLNIDMLYTYEIKQEDDLKLLSKINEVKGTLNSKLINYKILNIDHHDNNYEIEYIALNNLYYNKVAVGGTFDRLHAGHRLLLSISAFITNSLYIGITKGLFMERKQYKEMIETYEDRCKNVLAFLNVIKPNLIAKISTLSDPKEPTVAETERDMEALMVSEETYSGGKQINKNRLKRGFSELDLISIDLIGIKNNQKLSSSELRKIELENVL